MAKKDKESAGRCSAHVTYPGGVMIFSSIYVDRRCYALSFRPRLDFRRIDHGRDTDVQLWVVSRGCRREGAYKGIICLIFGKHPVLVAVVFIPFSVF